MLSVEVNIKL